MIFSLCWVNGFSVAMDSYLYGKTDIYNTLYFFLLLKMDTWNLYYWTLLVFNDTRVTNVISFLYSLGVNINIYFSGISASHDARFYRQQSNFFHFQPQIKVHTLRYDTTVLINVYIAVCGITAQSQSVVTDVVSLILVIYMLANILSWPGRYLICMLTHQIVFTNRFVVCILICKNKRLSYDCIHLELFFQLMEMIVWFIYHTITVKKFHCLWHYHQYSFGRIWHTRSGVENIWSPIYLTRSADTPYFDQHRLKMSHCQLQIK